MPRTIDQKIAETVNKLQRLKTKKRTKDTRRKIIVGAVVTTAAFKDRALAQRLLDLLDTALTRDVDKRDAEPLITDLRNFLGKAPT